MDQLEGFLETTVVTVRWLANTLQISSAEAEILMEKYKVANKESLVASYLVTGVKRGSASCMFLFVSEEELEACKAKLSTVNGSHIYSLQKREKTALALSTAALVVQVQGTDSAQASELLFMTHHNSGDFLKNTLGRIKRDEKIKVSSLGERHLVAQAMRLAAESAAQPKKEALSSNAEMAKRFEQKIISKKTKVLKVSLVVEIIIRMWIRF